MSKDGIMILNATSSTTTYGSDTVTTMIHLVSYNSSENWKASLAAMSEDLAPNTKSKIVLMVLKTADMQNSILESFSKVVDEHKDNLLFHFIIATDTKADWYQVLKVKNIHKSVFNLLQFDQHGYIIEDYNLHGMTITSKENSLLNFTQSQVRFPRSIFTQTLI